MADYLTQRLEGIPGIAGPTTPDYADPVHFMYVIEFRPQELGVDRPVAEFKAKIWAALEAEGLPILQWQREIVPAMSFFQSEQGYASMPAWRMGGSTVRYDPADYRRAQQFVDSHAYLRGVHPPNGLELMDSYLAAIEKVLANAPAVLA